MFNWGSPSRGLAMPGHVNEREKYRPTNIYQTNLTVILYHIMLHFVYQLRILRLSNLAPGITKWFLEITRCLDVSDCVQSRAGSETSSDSEKTRPDSQWLVVAAFFVSSSPKARVNPRKVETEGHVGTCWLNKYKKNSRIYMEISWKGDIRNLIPLEIHW